MQDDDPKPGNLYAVRFTVQQPQSDAFDARGVQDAMREMFAHDPEGVRPEYRASNGYLIRVEVGV